ncbi:histone-lysine N-methyltransferase Smyd1-like isoform X1 [Oncorhynchus keta]|uniref:histone-lysine N-methyltransferase Smyd1-like isoform X1 n=1 Tax=Oncorhynchus keta TaxID=8018 RepID=UPI0015F7A73C|nr:histone-lysine N-methyltransferase Smyd1-like isoform X1 [Oncorhynchus keta]
MTLDMDNVEVFDAGEKGRGLRTTKDLWAGEVVFAEPSFAAVVFDSLSQQVCHSCFRRQANLHRCAQCKFAHYCDRTCQTACWDEHKQECAAIKKYEKAPNENVRLTARVLWRIQKDTGIVSDGQLTSVDQLEDHVADMLAEDFKELKIDMQNFLDYCPKTRHGKEYISHIFGIIKCNGFTLSDQRGLQAVGVGLFPNLCLVNHDCWPNCTVILNHGNQSTLNAAYHSKRRIELRALSKIAENEELTVGYVDFLNVSTDRQRALKHQYHFDCTCKSCSEHLKDDLKMAAKETNGNKPSDQLVKEVQEFSLECLAKVEAARTAGDFHEVVKLCRECLDKQEPVFGKTHLYHLRMLSTASEVLSYLQFFSEAAEYAGRLVEGYMKLYHPNNAHLGMATMRAGVTHWHAGLIKVGHEMICKAYAILMVTHGPSHPITKDLESMRMQTEIELRMFKQNEHVYHSMREAALQNKPMAEASSVEDNIKALSHKQ